MPWLAICRLGEANALAVDNRATSAKAVMRVLKRVSKEFSAECRALLGARVGLEFMFGSSLNLFLLLIRLIPLPPCFLKFTGRHRFKVLSCRTEVRQPVKSVTARLLRLWLRLHLRSR